jgi:hypothetical protein
MPLAAILLPTSSVLLAPWVISKVKPLLVFFRLCLRLKHSLARSAGRLRVGLLSIFFAIFGEINDETTDALIKLNEVTNQIPFSAITRSDRFLRIDNNAFKQNPGANGPPAVHNYHMHVFEAGNLASPRTWYALGRCANR